MGEKKYTLNKNEGRHFVVTPSISIEEGTLACGEYSGGVRFSRHVCLEYILKKKPSEDSSFLGKVTEKVVALVKSPTLDELLVEKDEALHIFTGTFSSILSKFTLEELFECFPTTLPDELTHRLIERFISPTFQPSNPIIFYLALTLDSERSVWFEIISGILRRSEELKVSL